MEFKIKIDGIHKWQKRSTYFILFYYFSVKFTVTSTYLNIVFELEYQNFILKIDLHIQNYTYRLHYIHLSLKSLLLYWQKCLLN